MELIVSAILAYLLLGFVQIIGDLGSSPQGKPFWAMEPTLGKALFYGLTWVVRPIVENYYSTGQFARSLVFGLLTIFTKMIAVTLYIFGCFFVTSHFFDNISTFAGTHKK